MKLFRDDLSAQEIQEFKQWARDNYEPFTSIKGFWHPIVQQECTLINQEAEVSMEEYVNG